MEWKHPLKILVLVTLILAVGVFTPSSVYADINQLDHSVTSESRSGDASLANYQTLGTGFSGVLNSLSVWYEVVGSCSLSNCPKPSVSLASYGSQSDMLSDINRTTEVSQVFTDNDTNSGGKKLTISSISYTFDSSKYYAVRVVCNTNCSNGVRAVKGSSGNTLFNGALYFEDPNDTFTNDNNVGDMYLELDGSEVGQEGEFDDSLTQILSIDDPDPPFQSGAALTNTFGFTIWSASPVPDQMCIFRDNLTTNQSLVPVCEDVLQSGEVSFSESLTFDDDSVYVWRAVILDSSGVRLDQSIQYTYQTGDVLQSQYEPDQFNFPAGTATSTIFAAWGSALLTTIKGIAPISYFFQIDEAVRISVEQWDETQEEVGLDFTLPTLDGGTTTVTILSDEQLNDLVSPEVWETIRAFVALSMWGMFGFVAFDSVRSRMRTT